MSELSAMKTTVSGIDCLDSIIMELCGKYLIDTFRRYFLTKRAIAGPMSEGSSRPPLLFIASPGLSIPRRQPTYDAGDIAVQYKVQKDDQRACITMILWTQPARERAGNRLCEGDTDQKRPWKNAA